MNAYLMDLIKIILTIQENSKNFVMGLILIKNTVFMRLGIVLAPEY